MMLIAWTAIRAAVVQIMIAFLTSQVMKLIIMAGLKKLAARTDNVLDDKIIQLVEDALNNKTSTNTEEASNDQKICTKCKAVLD